MRYLSLQEDAELFDNPSRMALDNTHEGFVRDTSLHPIDPVIECLGEYRARTFRSNRADANGSRIDDVLTSTALRDGRNHLQFPDCIANKLKFTSGSPTLRFRTGQLVLGCLLISQTHILELQELAEAERFFCCTSIIFKNYWAGSYLHVRSSYSHSEVDKLHDSVKYRS